ncbi:hypothetical protein [Aeromonas veronii]|uniref:hypothetical protein n=1 Tax=Aeromonas veronii TaxID=654 RepID=UPI0032F076C1
MKQETYTIVSGGTFRKRIPREDLQDFLTIANNGSFWAGKNRMTVTATDEHIELLISNTSGFTKGDHEFKVTGLDSNNDTVVLVYGRIRVIG